MSQPVTNTVWGKIGLILLFLPYAVVLFPFIGMRVVIGLRNFYFRKSPQALWNSSVDAYPRRKLTGYLIALVIISIPNAMIISQSTSRKSLLMDLIRNMIYLSLPLLLSIFRPLTLSPCDASDIMILIFLIVPIEIADYTNNDFLFDLTISIVSSWPEISLLRMSALNVGLFIFLVFRPLKDIGIGVSWNMCASMKWIALRFCFVLFGFLVVGVPLAFAFGFARAPHEATGLFWRDGVGRLVMIFVLVSLPLEILYRGVVQNLLHARFDSHADIQDMFRKTMDDERRLSGIGDTPSMMSGDDEDHGELRDVVSYHTFEAFHVQDDSIASESTTLKTMKRNEMVSSTKTGTSGQTFVLSLFESNEKSLLKWDFEDLHSDDENDEYTVYQSRNTCDFGFKYWAAFRNLRDWISCLVSGLFYSVTSVYWNHGGYSWEAFFLVGWLGFCCGYLWRHTDSCLVSALLQAVIVFLASSVFNPVGTYEFCHGAC